MSGTLALSSFIASLDREGLIELIRTRRVASPNGVNDAIDLATELLKPDSIAQALAVLNRDELATLSHASTAAGTDALTRAVHEEALPPLLARGLLVEGPATLPEVTQSLESLLTAHGLTREDLEARTSADADSSDSPNTGASSTATAAPVANTSAWYAAALTTTGQAAWLLRDIARTPAKLNRNGTIASVWVKAFEERLRIPRADELVELLRASNLVEARGHELAPTAAAWLNLDHEDRWAALVRAAVRQMPRQVFTMLGDVEPGSPFSHISHELSTRFPLTTPRTVASVESAASLWERLGITVGGSFSAAGISMLRRHAGIDVEAPHFDLPATAPGVYIQPDLSVVVPGPLTVQDEASLAALALPEQLGVASTLRITEASLIEALDRGSDAQTVRSFLERITLTGIPQPLDYLITSLQQRAGSIVVSLHEGDEGRTRIDFLRSELRSTILVDRSLVHLQLHEAESETFTGDAIAPLFSRIRPDHVLAALLDARYPAAIHPAMVASDAAAKAAVGAQPQSHDEAAGAGSADPHPTSEASTESLSTPAEDPAIAIADRVLAALSDGPGEISRQVTLAVRDRSTIKVSVEMRGKSYEFTVVPVSIAAGRMRALDQVAEVERTIPVDAITAITLLS